MRNYIKRKDYLWSLLNLNENSLNREDIKRELKYLDNIFNLEEDLEIINILISEIIDLYENEYKEEEYIFIVRKILNLNIESLKDRYKEKKNILIEEGVIKNE